MRNLILSSILLLSSIIPINLSFAHVNDIRFRQISPPGGFTLEGIKCIIQDDLGYIWMGTSQGLIKIDSKNTNWFVPSSHDPFSLPSEMISNVFCDSNNQIWVSTNRGLCKFVREQQNFEHISYTYEDGSKSSESVIAVLKTENDKLLIIDAFYFGFLNLRTKQFIRIGLNQIDAPTKLYKDKMNRIWIGTLNGDIFRYHSSNNKVRKLISVKAKVNSIFSENHEILVGTEGEGASLYDIEGTFIKKISFSNKSSYSNNGNVRVIKKDKAGRFWFGTYEGLYMDDGRKIERFKPDDYPGLPHNSIYEIFEDKYGVLWFGTWSGGVALIHQSDNNFKTFRHSLSHNSISNSKATAFVQIDKNELLIGTEVGGLNSYNLNTGEFKLVNISATQEIETIKSLCIDKQGGTWVGTFRKGLWYRSKGSKRFTQFMKGQDDGQHISSESVYALCAIDTGVWIGTFQNGINFYSFKTKTIRHCFLNSKDKFPMQDIAVTCIHSDTSKNLWIGTYSGILYKIHLPTEDITQYAGETSNNTLNRLENNTIFHIWEHDNGDLWCATNNKGILILNPTSSLIRNFDAGGLLKGKNAYGIIEDQNKIIWITSNIGLLSYNPLTQTVRQFVYSDGIQSDVFCPQAVYRDTRDNLYFGGANGFTKINGANLHLNTRKPFTVINKVTSNNKKTIYPIYADRFETNPIILNPEETTFRINFSSDNYLLPEKNKYKYRLINFYDKWIDVQNEGSVLFTNVDAGEYIFEVKSCNNDGIWNEVPSRMHLKISNHWYFTKGAYFIYVLLFSFVVYLIARLYYERIRLKQVFLLEKNKRENEEQIHEMKLKFFTNISHEFRTPLTLISWPLRRILNADNITQEQREELEVAKRNSNRLLQLINQIIDFRKLEKGKIKLNISKIDIIDFTKELLKGFSTETKTREINFLFVSPFSTLEIEADREKLDTILYNLLSNAYKYVSDKGEIKITINTPSNSTETLYSNQLSFGEMLVDDYIEIAIEDTGSGINNEDLLRIFTRFEQGSQNDNEDSTKIKGSGIGLAMCRELTLLHHGKITVQSDLGKGSRFTVVLPSKQKASKVLFESHKKVKNLHVDENSKTQLTKTPKPEKESHILIVEDNTEFRKLISTYLSQYYHIQGASNGKDALQITKTHHIDLLISDVMMPDMDGFELCSILKTQLETSHIPVILLTALSSSENVITGLDKGADAYLTKPFDEDVLRKQIENILKQRQRIKENFSKHYISRSTVEASSLDNYFLNRVRAVVEKNISDESFNMDYLAEELMISRSKLHRKIKSLSGLTTSEFVNLIRIKKAVELINKSNYRFNEVAYQVGFSSQSYFNRCFKKVYNTTPKDYFENNKSIKINDDLQGSK